MPWIKFSISLRKILLLHSDIGPTEPKELKPRVPTTL